ncbi:hypothetical protein [Thalassotalea mangrovi]|uniref:Uncharacterized protein n=1 Tax=Thalassotalea mangrovi TaxID=2572245 RepID=A0A4U1B993_9GAMM|nr:hypothetical protein [Thalassotalea mangrovi]TKB47135.1 hypothetical protein E8M12_02425 [Thalassotalea mangrovi]
MGASVAKKQRQCQQRQLRIMVMDDRYAENARMRILGGSVRGRLWSWMTGMPKMHGRVFSVGSGVRAPTSSHSLLRQGI